MKTTCCLSCLLSYISHCYIICVMVDGRSHVFISKLTAGITLLIIHKAFFRFFKSLVQSILFYFTILKIVGPSFVYLPTYVQTLTAERIKIGRHRHLKIHMSETSGHFNPKSENIVSDLRSLFPYQIIPDIQV
jgi:hypothetical protein